MPRAASRALLGVALRTPHGGVLVLAIPNAVSPLRWYALAIVAGTLVTTIVLLGLKPSLSEAKRDCESDACAIGAGAAPRQRRRRARPLRGGELHPPP